MLRRGIKYLVLSVLLISCNEKLEKAKLFYEVSTNHVGYNTYHSVLLKLNDSITHWKLNKISLFNIDTSLGSNYLDTLLCFNTTSDRFITCILTLSKNRLNPTGVLNYFFGEKQNGQWFFFPSNTSVFIPNSMKTNKKNCFFDYDELHSAALKNVYGGYLLETGQINEGWFISNFEGIGWGNFNDQSSSLEYLGTAKNFTDKRKFFEAIHLQSVKNNWANRDTTKPVVPFPINSLQ